jgi:hypothetical protein
VVERHTSGEFQWLCELPFQVESQRHRDLIPSKAGRFVSSSPELGNAGLTCPSSVVPVDFHQGYRVHAKLPGCV